MSAPIELHDAAPTAADSARRARVEQAELLISRILRAGVLLSLVTIVAGTIVSFSRHPDYRSSTQALARLTRGESQFPHTLTAVVREAAAGQGHGLVMLGILLLIATPVVRVAVSVLVFFHQGDRAFVYITALVLALLLASFWLGKAG